ncbi:MAG: glycosyltransferase, partial [Candidatus Sumerlaeota bacterium]|nr:glycosyltransferase [Candidatus Sumerlaeota bacterium]
GKSRENARILRHFRQNFPPGEAEILSFLPSPADIIRHAHVAVSCSELEGLPQSILEYMEIGVPVVCSDIPAHRQLIDEEETGLLFPVGNQAAMLTQIHRVLNDETLRQKLIRQAREAIAYRRWANTAAHLMDAYRRAMERVER